MAQDRIDAALVSFLEGDGSTWKAKPGLPWTREEILASAGSCCSTRRTPPPQRRRRGRGGAERLALNGMSCQSSVPPGREPARPAGAGWRLGLSIGLLAPKTFDDAIFDELFEAKYGLRKQDMVKVNVKGAFQIWMRGRLLPRGPAQGVRHAWTREG